MSVGSVECEGGEWGRDMERVWHLLTQCRNSTGREILDTSPYTPIGAHLLCCHGERGWSSIRCARSSETHSLMT